MDTDVLIVGAGPTGLMLAIQLARRGVRVNIIDRHAGPAQQSRALGVQARTLEIYAKLGLAERAIELGKIGTGANLWANGRRMGRVPLGDAGRTVTPYPYILVLGQDDNELLMGEHLRELGVEVQWNTELVSLQQDEHRVVASLKQADGSLRDVTASWIGGCDGARSPVRELCGIDFPGAPYEHVFFVADTESVGDMVPDEVNIYLWRSGFHLFFPMRGENRWRIVGILPPALRDRDDVALEAVTSSLQNEAGANLRIESCNWFSTYRIHHRRAARFRQGRCFLLGDAAHVHSPVGAQGMNTGLQDAYNLGWKLALVINGQADADLLASYEAERIPVAEHLLGSTDQMFRLIVSDNPLAGLFRTQVAARIARIAMKFPAVQRLAFRTVSQTTIHYQDSSLSKHIGALPHDAPRSGDRFPWLKLRLRENGRTHDLHQCLDDRRFHLLVFGQSLPADAACGPGSLIEMHEVPGTPENEAALAAAKIPRHSFYLLRPDGHVGLCGDRIDPAAIRHYLEENLGLRSGSDAPDAELPSLDLARLQSRQRALGLAARDRDITSGGEDIDLADRVARQAGLAG